MGAQLDLDDVAATSKLAFKELKELRKRLKNAEMEADKWRHRYIMEFEMLLSNC